ncbi:hypothetical protein ACFLZH_03420 [Patescibacteria group bacterium]
MSKFHADKRETAELEHVSLAPTIEIRRPIVQTSELPAIPQKLITQDVSAQAAFVIDVFKQAESMDVEKGQSKESELLTRDRIVVQLEKVSTFLNKILQLYRDGFPTFPEQYAVYSSTISSNISSLENQSIHSLSVIVNLYKIVLPLLTELQMQFAVEEDENFNFDEVIFEIRECLVILAGIMSKDK